MKLTYKSAFSHLRIATAVTLMSAAAAMGVTALKISTPPSLGKADLKRQANDKFRARFQTLLSFGDGGEDGSRDGAAQEAYDNRAYPAALIAAPQQQAAANAASAIGKLPAGKKTNWQDCRPARRQIGRKLARAVSRHRLWLLRSPRAPLLARSTLDVRLQSPWRRTAPR